MINGGESAYFQTDLLDFDAFLTIFHFVRDSLWCYTWFHPSPDRLGLAVDTWSCCTFQVANEPVRIWYFPWNLACWFHCICATSMPDFIGISFKQAPWLKFDLENCRWLRPRRHWCCNVQFTSKIVHSIYRHQIFTRLISKTQCYYKSSGF